MELIGKLAAASLTSYILFLLPYLLSVLMMFPMILILVILLAAIVSAIISGLLLYGAYSIISPLAGSLASLLTNHLSEIFLGISAQVYLDWPYWALSFLASPVLAFLIASLRAERRVEREVEAAAAEEVVKLETEAAEEEMELIECPACGGQIPSDSIYCPLCGSRVAEEI